MAKQEFLKFLRVAQSLFAHQRGSADTNAKAIEEAINRADIWLTPKSVQGFDVADFSELGQDRRQQLHEAVRDFLDVARQVPPKEPATLEQVRKARPPFARILEILAPYLPTPLEKRQVETALKRVNFPEGYPPWAVSWDAEFGSDEDGNPEVWIDVYVDERTFPRDQAGRFASQLNAQIQQALEAEGSSRWPYLRLRSVAEHKQGGIGAAHASPSRPAQPGQGTGDAESSGAA